MAIKSSTSSDREVWIDYIKAIAIIFVIFTHCNWTEEQRKLLFFPFWINLAVPLFMIVTGYNYYNSLKKSVFIALSLVFMAGVTRDDVIEPPKKEFCSIIRVLSPLFPAFQAQLTPAVPPPTITKSYLFITVLVFRHS